MARRKGIGMSRKVDTDKHFRETQRAFARGGNDKMFGQQAANTKKPGIVGKVDQRGPGQKFATPGGEDRIFGGYATPAQPGVTATTRRGGRSRTRDYAK
jgi:hypothetical protein